MKLTTYQISEGFEFNTYVRGKQYFLGGKVISYTLLSESLKKINITARVKGSYQPEYIQNIIVSQTSYAKVDFQGDCSCPVQNNCKHVVAACFQYQYDKTHKPKDIVADWLDEIKSLSTLNTPSNNSIDNEHFIIYRLFFSNYGDDMALYKAKYLKNGKMAKGSLRKIENAHHTLDELMDTSDKEAIELLNSMRDYRYQYKIKGKAGYLFMKQILNTQRCFYENASEPLSFNQEKLPLNFQWSKVDNKRSLLEIKISSKNYRIIPSKPILVIDSENNQVMELDTDIAYAILEKIMSAPAIPNIKINTVYQSLSTHLQQLNLPTPKNFKVTTVKKTPIPIIHIYQDENKTSDMYLLGIDFIYGDYTIAYLPKMPVSTQFNDVGKIEIIRDPQQEAAALAKLCELGFESLENQGKHYMTIASQGNSQHALQQWNDFLNKHIDSLKKLGWLIEFNENFKLNFNSDTEIEVQSEADNDWFSLSFNVRFGENRYPLAPLVSSVLEEFDNIDDLPKKLFLECDASQFIELKTKEIKPVLKTLFELFDRQDGENILKIGSFDAHMLEEMQDSVTWKGSKEILKLSKKLKNFEGIKDIKPPSCLKLKLRDYQQTGLNWLNFLYDFKFSGILADDMGLGKTVQTLSHLSRLKEDNKLTKPALIVVPTSLVANWKNEVEKFTPNLNILTLYGSDRAEYFPQMNKADLILTTYTLVSNDLQQHEKRKYSYIILDEAQKIKNPRTKMARTICGLKSENRLALTGTPIENHLGELWSIFHFLMPGFLHNQKLFNDYYRKPIENDFDGQIQEQFNKRIKPFILRRTKADVLTELPAKTEIIKLTQFEEKQSKLYETIRIAMNKKVRDAVAQKGLNKSHIHILDALLKLRQVCCDPSILKLDEAKKVKESAKLTLFLELIDELMAEGRKVLVFSQFTTMLSILEREIKKKKISYVKLTGSSTKRDKIIDKFTNGEADIFLISLKAGGVGLNLVEADTVIHYDPWWNPAVENQATDRAHRIGQNKKVFVYKLIVENTIEQKIIELQKKKQALQDGIYDKGGKLEDKKFNGNELMALLRE